MLRILRKANSARMFIFFILFSLLVISTHAHAFCALTDDPVFDVKPTITAIHTADFEVLIKVDPPIGINPLFVDFSAKVLKGKVQSFLWDFGDGFTCKEQRCLHIYEEPGSYIVRLIVAEESKRPAIKKLAVFIKEKSKERP